MSQQYGYIYRPLTPLGDYDPTTSKTPVEEFVGGDYVAIWDQAMGEWRQCVVAGHHVYLPDDYEPHPEAEGEAVVPHRREPFQNIWASSDANTFPGKQTDPEAEWVDALDAWYADDFRDDQARTNNQIRIQLLLENALNSDA